MKFKFGDQTKYQVRANMIDCHIDICNLAILRWIKDDPNLKSLNSNFINGVVESEISSDKVFYFEIKDSFFTKI